MVLDEAYQYVFDNLKSPTEYIIDKFKKHDVIMIGEDHAIKHNLEFIQQLIPNLYHAGITNIGMEFGAAEDQDELDGLVFGDSYDDELARELMFRYNVSWAYMEYTDIYRAAFRFNSTLEKDQKKFRILNLSYHYNWNKWYDNSPESFRKVFAKGPIEEYRFNIIRKSVLDKKEKILCLVGIPHAITKYKLCEFNCFKADFCSYIERDLGNLLYQKYNDKVACVMTHFNTDGLQRSGAKHFGCLGNGDVERLMSRLGNCPCGFDLDGTPVGEIKDNSRFSYGYPDFHIGQFADGYIFLAPLSKLKGCTIDYDFAKKHSIKEIRENFPDPNWRNPPQDMRQYWEYIEQFKERIDYNYLSKEQ